MVTKHTGVGLLVALSAVFGTLLLTLVSTPVSAAGESYTWTDFGVIGGKAGSYRDAINPAEGGTPALEFKQSPNNPAVFVAEPNTDRCQGKLTLTLTGSQNAVSTGTLSSSGNCPLFNDLDKTISVSGANLIRAKVNQDSLTMKNSFRSETCKDVLNDQTKLKQCDDKVNDTYNRYIEECKTQNDYLQQTYLANKYLDCLAEKMGVERPTGEKSPEEKKDEKSKCSIPDVGWMVCQVVQFLAWITDQAFNLLSNFLAVEPLKEQIDGKDSKLYAAWKLTVGFANVVFVFAFILMILAYTTNFGLSNYGLKKLTPRLIIAALLVNLSFYLCGIAVDLSNILGGTLKNTLVEMTPPASGSPRYSDWTQLSESIVSITPNDEEYTKDNKPGATGDDEKPDDQQGQQPPSQNQQDEKKAEEKELWPPETEAMIAGVALVGGVVLLANLSVLIPFMATALAAIVIVLIVLIIRQAVIICLIAISPLAIALFVLPNTKQWFDRWLDIFSKLLLIYPVVALVFGAAYFASRVVLDQAVENSQSFLAMFALGIQVIPLFITPVIMKFGGGVMDRFAGFVNNPNKGPLDRMKKGAKAFREDRKNLQQGRAASGAFSPTIDPSKSKLSNRVNNLQGRAKNFIKNPNAARLRHGMNKEAGESALSTALDRSKKAAFNNEESIRSAAQGLRPTEFRDQLIEESMAHAAQELHDIKMDRVNATVARFKQDDKLNADTLHEMATSGQRDGKALSDVERAAAVQMAANTAESEKAHDLILASSTMNDGLRRILVDSLRQSGFTKQNSHFGGSAMNKVLEGQIRTQDDINGLVQRAAEGGKFSAAAISGQSAYTLGMLNNTIDQGKVSQRTADRINQNAQTALKTPTLNANINTNSRSGIERLAR